MAAREDHRQRPESSTPTQRVATRASRPRRPQLRDHRILTRGQVEGGVAQGIGFALTENFHVDVNGVMVNPNLRNYRIPTFADVPRSEVLLVASGDSVGPMRSKGMAECCINPVAPALANALEDATGVRYRALPLTPERIYSRLAPSRLTAMA
jgi:putative selenate reductase molybdopterin-binding subunit